MVNRVDARTAQDLWNTLDGLRRVRVAIAGSGEACVVMVSGSELHVPSAIILAAVDQRIALAETWLTDHGFELSGEVASQAKAS